MRIQRCELPLLSRAWRPTSGYLTAVPGYASSISYSVNGMPYQVVRDNPLSYPDVTLTMGLDPDHMQRVWSIWTSGVTPPQDNWSTGSYDYDGAGNVKSIGSDTFEYDRVSRLTQGSLWVNGMLKQQESTFDPFGNVTSTTTSDWGTQTLLTDAATNRLSAAGYDPGGTGNVVSWGTFTYGYDKLSRLQTVTATGVNRTYLYTADGERISDRDNLTGTTTLTIRDLGGKVLRVLVNGTRTKDYVWGNGMLLASVGAPSTKRHFHLDHLGSPRLITNTSAAKVATHTYYPFGLEVPGGTADGERMKFTGHEREPYNHDSMHARHYNPTTLRFLTPDLLRGDVHRPQTFNLFAYVGGNPVNYVIRSGWRTRRRRTCRPLSTSFLVASMLSPPRRPGCRGLRCGRFCGRRPGRGLGGTTVVAPAKRSARGRDLPSLSAPRAAHQRCWTAWTSVLRPPTRSGAARSGRSPLECQSQKHYPSRSDW